MPSNRSILFTGSIGLKNEDDVFKELGRSIGRRAKRYPDGETGSRYYWIRWVFELFNNHPQLATVGGNEGVGSFEGQNVIPLFGLAEGVTAKELHFDTLGYAEVAIASYRKFKTYKLDGAIPSETLFQVSLPTAIALSTTFMDISDRPYIEPAIEEGLKSDVDAICSAIPGDQLAIQWDVCHEVVAHDGGTGRWVLHYDNILEGTLERVCRQLGYIPQDVEAGIHLCYGDPGHAHIVEPEKLSTCVALANGICLGAPRAVNWIHMPVPRSRDDDAYFGPLKELQLGPETELYLGLVHHTDGVVGTNKRITTAKKYVSDFGIATECGFGRRSPDTIPDLLRIHTKVADGS